MIYSETCWKCCDLSISLFSLYIELRIYTSYVHTVYKCICPPWVPRQGFGLQRSPQAGAIRCARELMGREKLVGSSRESLRHRPSPPFLSQVWEDKFYFWPRREVAQSRNAPVLTWLHCGAPWKGGPSILTLNCMPASCSQLESESYVSCHMLKLCLPPHQIASVGVGSHEVGLIPREFLGVCVFQVDNK